MGSVLIWFGVLLSLLLICGGVFTQERGELITWSRSKSPIYPPCLVSENVEISAERFVNNSSKSIVVIKKTLDFQNLLQRIKVLSGISREGERDPAGYSARRDCLRFNTNFLTFPKSAVSSDAVHFCNKLPYLNRGIHITFYTGNDQIGVSEVIGNAGACLAIGRSLSLGLYKSQPGTFLCSFGEGVGVSSAIAHLFELTLHGPPLQEGHYYLTQGKEGYGSGEPNHPLFRRLKPVLKCLYISGHFIVGYLLCVWGIWKIWKEWRNDCLRVKTALLALLFYVFAGLIVWHGLNCTP